MTEFLIQHINLGAIHTPFKCVADATAYNKTKVFCHTVYQHLYPDIQLLRHDPGDRNALILYRENTTGEINTMFRLALDCENGLPEECFLKPLLAKRREQGMKIGEFGRWVNIDGIKGVKESYACLYHIAKLLRLDTIAIIPRMQYAKFHTDKIGAELLCPDIGAHFGSHHVFGAFAWDIAHTKTQFFKWAGIKLSANALEAHDD